MIKLQFYTVNHQIVIITNFILVYVDNKRVNLKLGKEGEILKCQRRSDMLEK
jgi:hypothetical protein